MSFRRQYKQAGTGETSSRWAWPPGVGGGGVGAGGGPRGGSLSALDLLDRSADEPDAGWPQTEAELAKLYQSTIMEQQQRHLEPLREDLADWLNKILGELAKTLSHRLSIRLSIGPTCIFYIFHLLSSSPSVFQQRSHCRLLHMYRRTGNVTWKFLKAHGRCAYKRTKDRDPFAWVRKVSGRRFSSFLFLSFYFIWDGSWFALECFWPFLITTTSKAIGALYAYAQAP